MGNSLAFSVFVPKQGFSLAAYIIVSLLVGLVFLFLLMKAPPRYRKYIVVGITFIMGWFYLLEFFIPGSSDTSPARRHFLEAQRHLQRASQSVAILDTGGRLTAEDRSRRIAIADRELRLAETDLQTGMSSVDRLKPGMEKDLKAVAGRAEAFARANRLSDKMLERADGDSGTIEDRSTINIRQRLSKLGEASTQAQETLAAVREARSKLSTVNGASPQGLSAAISGAAEGAGLAAGNISSNFLTAYKDVIATISGVVGSFTLGLGIINLLMIHFKTIARRRLGWSSSLAFYLAFLAFLLFGFMKTYGGKGSVGALGDAGYNMLFHGGLSQLQATMFSMVAFYIVSAAYRAFRVRSAEAGLMMAAAFFVMLGFVPFGIWLTNGIPPSLSFLHLETIRGWIMDVPNAAAQRGMAFGIGVGALAMALRVWLSLERGSYFDKQM